MSKTNLYLFVALVVQMGLGALTWTTCESGDERVAAKALLGIETKDVTELTITAKPYSEDKEPDRITLAKKDGKWVVASAADFPADETKVTEVLDKLVALKAKDPIAMKSMSHNALKVGEREYGRKVVVKTASEAKQLVIGDGPGQSVHVRFDGKDEVYRAKGLSQWAVKANLSGYVDTQYVDVDKDKLTRVTVTNEKGTLTFTKQDDKWTLAELPEGSELDDIKVGALMSEVSKLSLNEPVGKTSKPEHGLSNGVKVLLEYTEEKEAEDKEAKEERDTEGEKAKERITKTLGYTIGAKKDDTYFYVKADNNDFVVTISKWSTDQVREKGAEDFAKERKADEPESADIAEADAPDEDDDATEKTTE